MLALNHSHIGESHVLKGKPCQDASMSWSDGNTAVAIVSDGHGDPCCFRSDEGSKAAVRVAMARIREFVKETPLHMFSSFPFTQVAAGEQPADGMGQALRQLILSVVASWDDEVEKDSRENPVIDEELEQAENSGRHRDEAKEAVKAFSKAGGEYYDGLYGCYGCTLMAAVISADCWFAFHIGDGRLLAIDGNGNVSEPVPWDSRCYDNVTTSMCSDNPLSDFRYCYGGKGAIPDAIFLCSDGLEDSYVEDSALEEFARKCVAVARTDGTQRVKELFRKLFPELSRDCNINRDDISAAMVAR